MPQTTPARRRRALLGALAVALATTTALTACSSGSDAAASSEDGSFGEATMQLSWVPHVEFAGEYLADANGYFADAGFDSVTLTPGGTGATGAETAIASGSAFAGVSSPLITGPAISEGAEMKIVGATYQKNPFAIVSLTDAPIETPQDMVGKTIGVSDSNDLVWRAFLAANDIDESEIDRVPLTDSTLLTTGQVDGYIGYATSGANTLNQRGFSAQQFLLADTGLPMVGETIVVAQESIDDEREKVKALLYAVARGWKDAVADPEATAETVVADYAADQNYKVEEQAQVMTTQTGLIVTPDTDENGLLTITPELQEQSVESLALTGIELDADDLFDTTLIDEVYEEHPELLEG
ncbi:ABC transporter substrate-binding protein [Rathayibacter sp. VKM Ac-2754]|uniref:ABC transporter substrate-binding protein n=1 Tax=Rathayibacter sp. VKM Ac-2754 TaxID=2609251 RepID=UPI0013577891|nr:ABC transporter substrate-binding protein [Rathayibacter sp. VKM Ac-2754]MWV60051.1 ABC transporter substrate-binding protein [Rathayibacter sp. VKM Ac-2754]